jgi:hypothetical protein
MLVVVPSRGRPKNIERLVRAWKTTHAEAQLVVLVDSDDPELIAYTKIEMPDRHSGVLAFPPPDGPGPHMAQVLDHGVMMLIRHPYQTSMNEIVGFMGDDHEPQTPYWDKIIERTLTPDAGAGPFGIAYGDDGIQGEIIPTAVFISRNIIEALGYFCPPGFQHMYLDNIWKAWGQGGRCLYYLPDVKISHLHPIAGKAEWDDSYVATNNGAVYAADDLAFRRYQGGPLIADIDKIREVRRGVQAL